MKPIKIYSSGFVRLSRFENEHLAKNGETFILSEWVVTKYYKKANGAPAFTYKLRDCDLKDLKVVIEEYWKESINGTQ